MDKQISTKTVGKIFKIIKYFDSKLRKYCLEESELDYDIDDCHLHFEKDENNIITLSVWADPFGTFFTPATLKIGGRTIDIVAILEKNIATLYEITELIEEYFFDRIIMKKLQKVRKNS
jgi:hypothetical protein